MCRLFSILAIRSSCIYNAFRMHESVSKLIQKRVFRAVKQKGEENMVNQESLLDGGEPLEIERKFLIEYPDTALLDQMPDVRKVKIIQTYLPIEDNLIRRVRERTEGDTVDYWYTEKRRISDVVHIEREKQISQEQYVELLNEAAPEARPIRKTRYYLNANDLCFQIDIYPEWTDKALVEVELKDENDMVQFPDVLKSIREVTRDPRCKNESLAFNGFDF